MKRTKVLLINPSLKDSIITEVPLIITKFLGRQYNLGLLYLISSLREHEQHLEIDFFDAAYLNKSYAGIIAYVLDYNPDLIGITSVTHNIVTVLKIVQIIKRHLPRVHINLGGPHISLFPKDSLLYLGVDSITVGDGENSFLNLALNLKNNRDYDIDGIYFKSKNYSSYKPELVENLDSLLPPARDLIVNKRYGYRLNSGHKITTMISSRGCPYSCSFCMVPNIKYRRRSVSSVLSEIDC